METQRALAAIVISLAILLGYQYFFVPAPPVPEDVVLVEAQNQTETEPAASTYGAPAQIVSSPQGPEQPSPNLEGRDLMVQTSLYQAVISENGGTIKSFKLNNYREELAEDSPAKELITSPSDFDLPLLFNWGVGQPANLPLYSADRESITTENGQSLTLNMKAVLPSLEIEREMTFSDDKYMIGLNITVRNTGMQSLQGAPNLTLANRPFSESKGMDTQWLFSGPAVFLNNELLEIDIDDLDAGPKTMAGNLSWLAYEDTYFMSSIMSNSDAENTVNISKKGEDTVFSTLSSASDIIPPGGEKTYSYTVFMGPKKLKTLQESGHNLEKIVNFGWFDVIAKPALYLLNFFYSYFHNYGVAVILVTVLFKLIFWPISHKGMKSMKTMSKIQPKMVKLREKYKDNKEKLNQEMIVLYKTYKVNPVGGCLPMILQIPVFFALYKVLLQTIELRHAPFMLWITDLSAPDRLFIGFDIPYLGGFPVLTVLMGASMFLQQKMTPTAADPTQAKIMMFLPVIFTFMFLNFASGLVLYWFINNLLSIGQQYFINKSVDA